MRQCSFFFLLLCASVSLWAKTELLLCFQPLQKTFVSSVGTESFHLDLSYSFTSEGITPSVALGPFKINMTRITVTNTIVHPLRTTSLLETRFEHPRWGTLSLFRADENHIGFGFECGVFKGIVMHLPVLESRSVFLPHRRHQGLSFLVRYAQGPITVRCIGSEYAPFSLEVSLVLHLGRVKIQSVLDSSEFPCRLTLGLEGENASLSHEMSLGREPIYSGSEQLLRVSQRSNITASVGSVLIGLDYLLTLQTKEEGMVRTDLRIRLMLGNSSDRIHLVWQEREGWSVQVKGRNGSLALSKGRVAYEFIAHLAQGEVKISLTSKGVFSIAYTYRFTIGQGR